MVNNMRRFKPSDLLLEKLCLTILDCLDAQEKNVMEYRLGFGIDHGMTHEEIGEIMGVTKQRISDIEEQALARIMKACRMTRMQDVRKTYKTKIGDLNLPPRTHNTLIGAGIIFVEQLCQYSEHDLRLIPGLGTTALKFVKRKLSVKGLSLFESEGLKALAKQR